MEDSICKTAKELKKETLSSWPMLTTEQTRILTNQLKRELLFKKREDERP